MAEHNHSPVPDASAGRPTGRRTHLKRLGAVAAAGVGVFAVAGIAGAADPLSGELVIRSATSAPASYSLSVSDALAVGDSIEADDRIEGTTAHGTVGSRSDGDADGYRFAGSLTHLTDGETYEVTIDPDAGRIVLAALGGFTNPLRYSFSVDGTLRAVETDAEDSVWWYLGYGAIDADPDVYAYSGELRQLIVENAVDVEVTA